MGFFAFIWPALTAVALLIFIALWAIITGILEIVAAIQLRKEMNGEWLLGFAGAISLVNAKLQLELKNQMNNDSRSNQY